MAGAVYHTACNAPDEWSAENRGRGGDHAGPWTTYVLVAVAQTELLDTNPITVIALLFQ